MDYKQQIRKNWTRRAQQAEIRMLNFYRDPGCVPDGSFVMSIAVRYHAAMVKAEKRRGK